MERSPDPHDYAVPDGRPAKRESEKAILRFACRGLHALVFPTLDAQINWQPAALAATKDELIRLAKRMDELDPSRLDPDSAYIEQWADDVAKRACATAKRERAEQTRATERANNATDDATAADGDDDDDVGGDNAANDQETADVKAGVDATAKGFADDRAQLAAARRRHRRARAQEQAQGQAQAQRQHGSNAAGASACTETCRRFESCSAPYNLCAHACPLKGTGSHLPERGSALQTCTRTMNFDRRCAPRARCAARLGARRAPAARAREQPSEPPRQPIDRDEGWSTLHAPRGCGRNAPWPRAT